MRRRESTCVASDNFHVHHHRHVFTRLVTITIIIFVTDDNLSSNPTHPIRSINAENFKQLEMLMESGMIKYLVSALSMDVT